MKLNKKNYFTKKNQYLTNSKVSDYLRDKEMFYARHISHEEDALDPTDAMIFGSAVDEWLTNSRAAFKKKYIQVSRRSRKSDTPWGCQIPEKTYDDIVKVCSRVAKSPALRTLKKEFISQRILWVDMNLNHFNGLAGIPDWYRINEKTGECDIVDLKTSLSIEPKKHNWKCYDMGYYRQMAFYTMLIELQSKIELKFKYWHLVIDKNTLQAQMFQLGAHEVAKAYINIKDLIIEIAAEKDFKNPLPSFDDAPIIGQESNVLIDAL
jgi:hypothetical protein